MLDVVVEPAREAETVTVVLCNGLRQEDKVSWHLALLVPGRWVKEPLEALLAEFRPAVEDNSEHPLAVFIGIVVRELAVYVSPGTTPGQDLPPVLVNLLVPIHILRS